MLGTDVFLTADLYQAKWADKARIVWHYKKYAVACTRVYTVCLHMEQAFETLVEEMKVNTDVLEETFAFY